MKRLKDENVDLELQRSIKTIMKQMKVMKSDTRVNILVRKWRLLLVLKLT